MISSSAAFTDPCSDGSLRNHVDHTATQTRPTAPTHTKIVRHDMNVSSQSTSDGVSPPTRCAPAKNTPWTLPRSLAGIQRENVRATHGPAPASPHPHPPPPWLRPRQTGGEGRAGQGS